MSIEVKFNSVVLRREDIEEHFPALGLMINSYLKSQRRSKKRKPRKKRKTAAHFIDEIIADIDAG
jgi:hypothetical protein